MRAHPSLPPFDLPLIIAHRGDPSVAPENTLIAFAEALRRGADGIELDVRLARDGVPVVIHDRTIRRTAHRPGVVAEMTSKQLSQVDVGSWFNRVNPKLARRDYSLQYVPTLSEVLQLVRDDSISQQRGTKVYAELKPDGTLSRTRELVESVIDLVRQHELHPQAIIISFDLKAVAAAKKIDPSIRAGALFAPSTRRPGAIRTRRMCALARDCGANEILLHRLLASRRAIEVAVRNDLSPVIWTVDHPGWIRRAMDSGIHALITNNPAKLKAVIRELRPLNS